MDYKSYKAMCDSTLQEIRKSEKSIIKTLESQQKEIMAERQRRTERNENILRALDRIDYQSQLLASKTAQLRTLKKQYERYLLSLCTAQRLTTYPLAARTYTRPFTAKYDESPAHQSPYYTTNYDLMAPNYAAVNPYNQSHYRGVPLTPSGIPLPSPLPLENSINSSDYRATTTTGVVNPFYPPYPFMPVSPSPQVRHDERKLNNNNNIDMGSALNMTPTINSITSRHNSSQPLDVIAMRNYNNESVNVSPPSTFECAPSRLKNISKPQLESKVDDEETDSEAEKCEIVKAKMAPKRMSLEIPLMGEKYVDVGVKKQLPQETVSGVVDTTVINDSGKLHQVWEKVIETEPPSDVQLASNIVIPKIIVETQVEIREEESEKHDIPEKLLNQTTSQRVDEHSSDNRQNGSLLSTVENTSAPCNNLPLAEAASTIYHDDKQPESSSELKLQTAIEEEALKSTVEYELRNFNEIEISPPPQTYIDDAIKENVVGGSAAPKSSYRTNEVAINNNNDGDKNQNTPVLENVELNDKISEIYRKIERIEGEYYDEKGKIMENFERRMSTSSLNDSAKDGESQFINSRDEYNDDAHRQQSNQEFNLNENVEQERMSEIQIESQSNYNYERDDGRHEMETENAQQQENVEDSANISALYNASGELQTTPIEQYTYESQSPYQYENNNVTAYDGEQYEAGYVQEAQGQESNYYNAEGMDSNYQQIPTDYSNEAAANYYDDPNQNQQPYKMYEDPNYSAQYNNDYYYQQQQQQEQQQNYEVAYDNSSLREPEMYPESNYSNTDVSAEYQEPLENANYEELQQQQPDNFEIDESYQTSTTSNDETSKADVEMNVSGEQATTKREDVKLVKQLLDSESDDASVSFANASNLLQTAIKEEADESDFDFSTN